MKMIDEYNKRQQKLLEDQSEISRFEFGRSQIGGSGFQFHSSKVPFATKSHLPLPNQQKGNFLTLDYLNGQIEEEGLDISGDSIDDINQRDNMDRKAASYNSASLSNNLQPKSSGPTPEKMGKNFSAITLSSNSRDEIIIGGGFQKNMEKISEATSEFERNEESINLS